MLLFYVILCLKRIFMFGITRLPTSDDTHILDY